MTSPEPSATAFLWRLFALVFVLSVPLWWLASVMSREVMPGLPVSSLMFLCPAAVACVYAARRGGTGGLRDLLLRIVDFRRTGRRWWHLVSLLLMPTVLLLEYVLMVAAGMPLPDPSIAWRVAPLLLCLFLFAAACEELTWTATALEPLQRRLGALRAGLLIGVVWAAWHAIPFAQGHPSTGWVMGQCLFTVAFRVVLVWLYNATGLSLFATIVCHATYNTAWQLFPNQGSGYNPWIAAVLTTALAVLVTLASRLWATGVQHHSPIPTHQSPRRAGPPPEPPSLPGAHRAPGIEPRAA